jgi:alpha-ketoglutarate-dependent taurine dioxygenase
MTMNGDSSFVPRRVADPAEAFALLRAEGAVILTDSGASREDARGIAQRVVGSLAPVIPDPAPIKEGGGNRDQRYDSMPGVDAFTVPFQTGHTDGFAYGDAYPDFIFLLCVRAAESGGESFVVDTYALLDALRDSADEADRAFHTFLTTMPVEQTEPTFRRSIAPVVHDNGHGRRMSRWTPVQRPDATRSPDEIALHTAWLERWTQLCYEASQRAPRFTLQPGETICLDNYRMLHGRTGFNDTERTLWRIWAWTSEALRVPEGMLFSDSRYAVTS